MSLSYLKPLSPDYSPTLSCQTRGSDFAAAKCAFHVEAGQERCPKTSLESVSNTFLILGSKRYSWKHTLKLFNRYWLHAILKNAIR